MKIDFIFVIIVSFCSWLLAGCTRPPSHLPAPLPFLGQLPGALVSHVYEGASYGARRKRTEKFMQRHYEQLLWDIQNGAGQTLDQALESAKVQPQNKGVLVDELRSNPDIYLSNPRADNIQAMLSAFMVYS